MKRRDPQLWGRFGGGGGQGWKAKRGRTDGDRRGGGGPVVRWSHAEAMKKSPTGGVDAAVAGGGGGWKRCVLGPGKAELGGASCGQGFK